MVSGLKRFVGVWTIVAEYRYPQGDARHDRQANHRLRKAAALPAGKLLKWGLHRMQVYQIQGYMEMPYSGTLFIIPWLVLRA